MLNKVFLQGRLTAEPEKRYTQNQTPVTSFSVAVNRDYNTKECDFVNCVAWKSSADFVEKYFHKGDMIILVGRLQVRSYTDNNGNKRTATEVVVESNYFAGSKKSTEEAPGLFKEMLGEDDPEIPF